MAEKPNYYLIAVSTRKNLESCIHYGISGFTNSINGAWAFLDINEGDFITFIYGARAFNLYRVSKKAAIENAGSLPPWDMITFKESGKEYYFPFRFELELIREFNESIVRYEFTYVAENLLLRGGYRKTHFQADQTTLQNVSSMGRKAEGKTEKITYGTIKTFTPTITFDRNNKNIPYVYKFSEIFLQSVIKHFLSDKPNLRALLEKMGFSGLSPLHFEVLSEKALPQGHIDLLVKEAVPLGTSRQVVLEVKVNKATHKDAEQLTSYVREIGSDCAGGILIAKDFNTTLSKNAGNIKLVRYSFGDTRKRCYTFSELIKNFSLA